MALTEQTIRDMLDLKSKDVFAIESMRHMLSPEQVRKIGAKAAAKYALTGRSTGNTTNAIVEALVRASKGEKVYLVNNDIFGLGGDLDNYARKLGIDPALIVDVPCGQCVFDVAER